MCSKTTMTTTMTSIVRMILTTEGQQTLAKKARGGRRRAREFALQGIYSWIIQGAEGLRDAHHIDAHIRHEEGFDVADFDWYHNLLYGLMRDARNLLTLYMRFVDCPLAVLSHIVRGVLLLDVYEHAY